MKTTENTKYSFNPENILLSNCISKEQFDSTGFKWDDLEVIYKQFIKNQQDLQNTADHIRKRLQNEQSIHSIRMRIKDPEHLVAKIIIKKIENPSREITIENYVKEITDLIGLRAIHLFKDQWKPIDTFIKSSPWELYETPVANYRKGDPEQLLEEFTNAGFVLKEHPFGYRSIHYILKGDIDKEEYLAELQVRTIFEEGWSEIDHTIRYPRHSDNQFLTAYLSIFNRLAGNADEMGTFIQALSDMIIENKTILDEQKTKNEEIKSMLDKTISELKISKIEKSKLLEQIEHLRSTSAPDNYISFSGQNYNSALYQRSVLGNTVLSMDRTVFPMDINSRIVSSFPSIVDDGIAGRMINNFGNSNFKTCRKCGKQYISDTDQILLDELCPSCRITG